MTDQMQSEIAQLNLTIEEIDDPRRAFAIVQERIRMYREVGREVPQDLQRIAKGLETECLIQSQGR